MCSSDLLKYLIFRSGERSYHDDRGERIESGGTGREADAGEEVLRCVVHVEPWREQFLEVKPLG